MLPQTSSSRSERISRKLLANLEPRLQEYTLWDCDLPGFGVRVRQNGAKSFIVVYRAGHGRKAPVRKLTLGSTSKLTPDEARVLARKALAAAAMGDDPADAKSMSRGAMTVRELAAVFMREHVAAKRKQRTVENYQRALDLHVLPAIGHLRGDKVTPQGLAALHLELATTPAMANYALAVIQSMYAFARHRKLVPDTCRPADRVEKYRENKRERYLTQAELGRLGRALVEAETVGLPWRTVRAGAPSDGQAQRTTYSPYAVGAVRFLLFTGCRLREALHLQWDYVDFERGLVFLPDSKTGRKTLVLNDPARDVLRSLMASGDFVFAGAKAGKPRHDLKKIWAALCVSAGLNDVRIHDLRHTFASFGVGSGMGLPVVGTLLGHAQASSTSRYAHLDADPVRKASQRIGGAIAAALDRIG